MKRWSNYVSIKSIVIISVLTMIVIFVTGCGRKEKNNESIVGKIYMANQLKNLLKEGETILTETVNCTEDGEESNFKISEIEYHDGKGYILKSSDGEGSYEYLKYDNCYAYDKKSNTFLVYAFLGNEYDKYIKNLQNEIIFENSFNEIKKIKMGKKTIQIQSERVATEDEPYEKIEYDYEVDSNTLRILQCVEYGVIEKTKTILASRKVQYDNIRINEPDFINQLENPLVTRNIKLVFKNQIIEYVIEKEAKLKILSPNGYSLYIDANGAEKVNSINTKSDNLVIYVLKK